MISELDDDILIPVLLRLARNIDGMPLNILEEKMRRNFGNPFSRTFIVREGDKVRGFVFLTIEEIEGVSSVLINSAYLDPRLPRKTSDALWNTIKEWARSMKIEDIYCFTRRRPFGFMHRYGFKLDYYMLKTKIKQGG